MELSKFKKLQIAPRPQIDQTTTKHSQIHFWEINKEGDKTDTITNKDRDKKGDNKKHRRETRRTQWPTEKKQDRIKGQKRNTRETKQTQQQTKGKRETRRKTKRNRKEIWWRQWPPKNWPDGRSDHQKGRQTGYSDQQHGKRIQWPTRRETLKGSLPRYRFTENGFIYKRVRTL